MGIDAYAVFQAAWKGILRLATIILLSNGFQVQKAAWKGGWRADFNAFKTARVRIAHTLPYAGYAGYAR